MKTRRPVISPAVVEAPNIATASVPPSKSTKVETSGLLMTSPVLLRLLQALGCRFFRPLGVVAIVRHGRLQERGHLGE